MVIYEISMNELQALKGRIPSLVPTRSSKELWHRHTGVTNDGYKLYYYDPNFMTMTEEVCRCCCYELGVKLIFLTGRNMGFNLEVERSLTT
jgi:hypothetical protein